MLEVIAPVSTLVAAFVGAWAAFRLENRRRKQQVQDKNITSLNLASFEFIRAYNSLANTKSQVLGELEHHPARHHLIKPVLAGFMENVEINYPSLSFILNIDSNVLLSVALIQRDVNGTVDIIKERSKFHYEYLQPAIEQIERSGKEEVTPAEVDHAMGHRRAKQLEITTNYMISGVNRGLGECKDIVLKLREAGKAKYPKGKFIQMEK